MMHRWLRMNLARRNRGYSVVFLQIAANSMTPSLLPKLLLPSHSSWRYSSWLSGAFGSRRNRKIFENTNPGFSSLKRNVHLYLLGSPLSLLLLLAAGSTLWPRPLYNPFLYLCIYLYEVAQDLSLQMFSPISP